jgi:CelD/BcsL family acetyltransferase involved in cellulose biosynthesis
LTAQRRQPRRRSLGLRADPARKGWTPTVTDIRLLDRQDDADLKGFLAGCPQASIFHTPEWRDALVATYDYSPLYIGCFEGAGLVAVLPLMEVSSWLTGKRLVSLPFSNICGPIGAGEAAVRLVDEAISLYRSRGAEALEIRTQADINPIADDRLHGVTYFITSLVDLDSDPEVVWKRFTKDSNIRTEVRQAFKKGLEVRAGETEKDLRAFYEIFAPARQTHGVPPQPLDFFSNLWRYLRADYLDLLLATHQGKPVGGFITLGFGKTLSAAYIGADQAFRSYRVHQALIWKAMEMGCKRGFERFDFLRTPKNSMSLRHFKERWGAYAVDLNYLYHPEVKGTAATIEETTKYRLLAAVLKRSPAFVGKALGKVLYRHLG